MNTVVWVDRLREGLKASAKINDSPAVVDSRVCKIPDKQSSGFLFWSTYVYLREFACLLILNKKYFK